MVTSISTSSGTVIFDIIDGMAIRNIPPRTENSVCRFAGLQRGGKKCGYRARLVGEETMLSPSSVAYGAKLLAVFFPLKGESFVQTSFVFTLKC